MVTKTKTIICLSVDTDLVDKLNERRGLVPLSTEVNRILKDYFNEEGWRLL